MRGIPASGRGVIWLRLGAVSLLVAIGVGSASVARSASAEPENAAPATGQGETALIDRIVDHFDRTLEEVKALRARGYGLGEVIMIYGLASAATVLPPAEEGGPSAAFDQALGEVLRLRESGLGWGEIAKQLGVHPSTLGQSVAGVVKEAERKADELHEAARRAGSQAPQLRQLGDELRRAAASAAESARELLPDPAREHFRRALDELRKGLEAATGSSDASGTGTAGSGAGKASGAPGGGPQDDGPAPPKEGKGAGHGPGTQGPGSKGGKGGA